MVKAFFKELVIAMLLILAIGLVLAVLFYDSIPSNKVVPAPVTYTLPENMQEELDKTLEEEQNVIVTYKIDENDLDIYEKNDSYIPGKIDPFSQYQSTSNPTTSVTGTAATESNSGNSNNSNNAESSNSSNSSDNNSDSTSSSSAKRFIGNK